MRITLLLLFCAVFQAGADVGYSQTQRLTLNLRDVTVKEALNSIEEQSEFYFLYNSKLVDVDRKVNVKARNQLISAVLDGMFASTDVTYKVEEKQIVLSRKNGDAPVATAAQQNTVRITGRVVDGSGEAVIGANVLEKGTTNGTATDVDGNFALTVADNAVLQVTYIGYIPQEISVLARGGGQISHNYAIRRLPRA
ncbi:MAG: carboxypeptidase-like regulatory domain-containing protein [Tannerella sp.]|nr:carboxypeptidase-like regulatory domain-containing protein [Tannerella sp.]